MTYPDLSRKYATRFLKIVVIVSAIFFYKSASAHPNPNSLISLQYQTDGVTAILDLPLIALERAFGDRVSQSTEPELRDYVKEHMQAVSRDGRTWSIDIEHVGIRSVKENTTGIVHHYIVVRVWLTPPAGSDIHDLTLDYDIIIHDAINHSAFVTVQQDWENGIYSDHPANVGVISANLMDRSVPPFQIDLAGGSLWKGFTSMLGLGMHHIAEGTDHLLFLLVLLFAAPLMVRKNRWAGYGGLRYSLTNLLKIVTAFTIGHSVTLLIGVLDLFQPRSQIIEILIAFSILISAIHALRPIFPKKEAYVAAGFGLIHGLAFAEILNNLNLDSGQLVMSLLGFNLGIEIMQLIIIAFIMPWLILLSQSSMYKGIRVGGAVFSGIAAIAWMIERIVGEPNPITLMVESLVQYAPWLIIFIALLSLFVYFYQSQTQVSFE